MNTNHSNALTSTWAERASWCLFDFANSAFVTVMITAFYSRFFTDVIARHTRAPASLWGAGIALSMLVVALISPVLGAIADRGACKRKLLRIYVLINVLACAGLSLVAPGHAWAVPLALALIIGANIAFEGAYVFYNAFLPELAPAKRIGRLSGYGWAIGYVGGLGCLALVIGLQLVPEHYDASSTTRALLVPLVVSAWFAVFAMPMLLIVRERAKPLGPPDGGYVRQALRDVRDSMRVLRRSKDLFWFFVAYLLFTDALETVIIFTGKFTGDALRFTPADTVRLFFVLNIVAAPGAVAFGWLTDKIGGVRGVALSLLLWLAVIAGSIVVQTKQQFWPIAVVAAIGLGATQSAARTVVARLVPEQHAARVFSMMTVVGRASAIVGPIVYGVVTDVTGSARLAIATVGVFLFAGLVLLRRVDEKRGQALASQGHWELG